MKRAILHHCFVLMEIVHLVSSGCVLHTVNESSEIVCQGLSESLENMQPLKAEGILTVNVTNSAMEIIPAGSFDNFRELRRIFLSGSSIKELEYGVFSSENSHTMLPFLMVLDLSENDIETLPSEIFNHSNVQEVDLSSNGLTTIELGAFKNMRKLQKLNLSFNKISSPDEDSVLPLGIFQDISTLNHLNISYNSLKSTKMGTFSFIVFLFTLDLSHNELTHLPPGTFIGIAIHELYLNDNKLVSFEYSSTNNIRPVINLVNNDFECYYLAEVISKLPNAFFVRGDTLTESNIYGISCAEEDVNEENDSNGDGNPDEEVLGEVYVVKYLSIATLCLGLVLACYVFFCQKNDEGGDDNEPVLKEVTPLQ